MATTAHNKPASKFSRFFHSKPMRIIGKTLAIIGKCLLTIILIGIITGSIVGCVMTVYVMNTYSKTVDIPDLRRIALNETSIVYTMDGTGENWVESQRLEGANQVWADYENIPQYMKDAVVAIEDERFWQHQGVDWKRTISAMANMVLHFSDDAYGGSTITQQVIKVVTDDNDVLIERKIREIFRAIEMEKNYYSKEEILEAYLNVLPLSGNVVGVGAAANYYFGKDIKDLDLAECAAVATITNLPSYYDPYSHPDHVKDRQLVVLSKMYALGMITEDEYIQAAGEELHYQSNAKYVDVQDYYADLLVEDIIADLQSEYGYNYNYAEQLLYFGGLRIYSLENPSLQHKLEEMQKSDEYYYDSVTDDHHVNSAMFIMDYEGRVAATLGGREQKTGNRNFSYSTDGKRQPGSAIKPLSTYAPAVDLDLINYSTIVRDAPIQLPDGEWWPSNFGMGAGDHGWTTVQYALEDSLNTVPVRIMEVMGIDTSFNFLSKSLHFTSLVDNDHAYAPLALGGFSYGVTTREMAGGYQMFGSGGYYNKPYTYEKVLMDDEIVLQRKQSDLPVISAESATVMNALLRKVWTQGTASSLSGYWPGWEMFGKTGTTTANNDVYFCGGSPYYTASCWIGYNDNTSLSYSLTSSARRLWNAVMLELHSGLEPKSFERWGDVTEAQYCVSSGQLATGSCGSTAWGMYKTSNVPPYCGSAYETPFNKGSGFQEQTTTPSETQTTAASSTAAPSATTQAPTEPTQVPTEPTQAPTEPTQAPTEPTQAPTEPTQAPTTPTAPAA